MNEYLSGPHHGQPFAEAVFVALDTIGALDCGRDDASPRNTVGFGDLYRLATDPARKMIRALVDALAASARLRHDLRHLLERTAPLHLSARAAASSATVTTRRAASFRITLRESHADRGQIYVIIRFDDAALPPPKTLFVIDDQRGCRKLPLPAPSAGAIQLLLEAESDLVAALRDPRTEVFMR